MTNEFPQLSRDLSLLSRLIRGGFVRTISNRSLLLITSLFYLLVVLMLSGLWRAAAEANGGSVVGYSTTALVWYAVTTEAAILVIPQRLIEMIGQDIIDGRIETDIALPTPVVNLRFGAEFGQSLAKLVAVGVVGFIFGIVVGGLPVSWAGLALGIPSLMLAVAVNIAFQLALIGATFWVRESKSSWFLQQKLVFLFGGMLLPLEVLPRSLEIASKIMPFSSMAYAPARLISGHVEPQWLAIQVGWLAVLWSLAVVVFRRGERRYVAAP